MSILIKGMEMPINDDMNPTAVWVYPNGYAIVFKDNGNMKQYTKAVPVPPHGRAIDADALDICKREQQAWQDYEHNPDNEYLEGVKDGLHEAAKCLSTASTIIEAEPPKEETDG